MSNEQRSLSAKNRFPSVPERDLQRLQDIWRTYYHTNGIPAGGMAELWYHTVLRFLQERGDEIVTGDIRRREAQVLASGLTAPYFQALIEVVKPELGDLSEATGAFLLITASPEERAEALDLMGRKP